MKENKFVGPVAALTFVIGCALTDMAVSKSDTSSQSAEQLSEAVIVASTSLDYPVGTIVPPGKELLIDRASSITLLNQDGELETFKGPFLYEGDRMVADGELAVSRAVSQLFMSAELGQVAGAVRSADEEKCESHPLEDTRETFLKSLNEGCLQNAFATLETMVQEEVALSMSIVTVYGTAGEMVAGQKVMFSVMTNADAQVYCDLTDGTQSVSLPLGENASYSVDSGPGVMIPDDDENIGWVADTSGIVYTLRCLGARGSAAQNFLSEHRASETSEDRPTYGTLTKHIENAPEVLSKDLALADATLTVR